MTKSEKQQWEQVRTKGYDRFLLRYGLLRAGLPFGVVVSLGGVLISIFTHHSIAPIWELLVNFGFYVVGFGASMGIMTWQSNERDYKKPADDDDMA